MRLRTALLRLDERLEKVDAKFYETQIVSYRLLFVLASVTMGLLKCLSISSRHQQGLRVVVQALRCHREIAFNTDAIVASPLATWRDKVLKGVWWRHQLPLSGLPRVVRSGRLSTKCC